MRDFTFFVVVLLWLITFPPMFSIIHISTMFRCGGLVLNAIYWGPIFEIIILLLVLFFWL